MRRCSSTDCARVAHANTASIEADFWAELAQIKAESIGWVPLEEGVYLHDDNATQVMVVAQGGDAVLLVGLGLSV